MSDYVLRLSDTEVARYRAMAQGAERDEREQWAAAGVTTGAVVADIGCGPGAVSAVLARLVGPTGTVHAVDRDPEALDLATAWARAEGLSNVVTTHGTATASGLQPGSVDVAMMRHVLAHNGGQEQAIVDHLATLVRPGGCVYLADIEATAGRIVPTGAGGVLADMTERYLSFHADLGNDLSVGLRLGELLTAAGLDVVTHQGRYHVQPARPGMRPPAWAAREQMLAAGAIDAGDIARWTAGFESLDRGELQLTMFIPTFTAFGRRPA